MARPQVRQVSAPSAIQPIASPVSSYVRPADPAPSSLHDLAKGLAAFDSGLGAFLQKRQAEKDDDDYQRGLAQVWRDNGEGAEEAVRQGLIPPQASPRFMEGLKTGQGNLAGIRLRNQFRQEFLQWEGRTKGDPEAFGVFLTDFITKNVPPDSDPHFLKGLNPHINTLFDEGYEGFTKDTSTALKAEGLRTDTASLTEVIHTYEEDGQASPSGIDYEAIWTHTLAIREEALKRGTLHADIDGHLIDTIILNAERTKDEGLLTILDKTLPGQEHPMSYGLEVQKKRDAAAEKIANAKARDEVETARQRKEREEKLAGQVYAEVATIWSRNIEEEIPETVIEDLARIDPMARSKLVDLRKKMAEADGIEDQATIARIFADIHEGNASKRDIMAHFERGAIRSTETLNQALDRVDRMEKERSEGSGILSDATLKKWHGLLEGLTGSDPINPFSGAGLTDEGLEAVHDMNMMVLEWEAQNPTASFIERQEAINRIGGIIRQRIELPSGQTIGGRYSPEAVQGGTPAQETFQPNPFAAPQPAPQAPAVQPQTQAAPPPQSGGLLDLIPNPMESAQALWETLTGSGEEEEASPTPQSSMPPLESLPEAERQAITSLAERHGVAPETVQRDLWTKVQELMKAGEEGEAEPGTGPDEAGIDPTTTNAIPEDIRDGLSSLFENPPQASPDAPLATAYVDPKSNPSVASEVLERFAGKRLPVSIRNNNMGAISITGDIQSSWAAKQPGFVGTTKRPAAEGGHYAKYATPEHGVAAASRLLERYGQQGINTPEAIVKKWSTDAKAHGAYARTLSKYLTEAGIEAGVDTPLDLSDPKVRIAVLKAKSAHESGAGVPVYANAVFERGANYRLGETSAEKPKGLAALAPNGLVASSKRGYQPDLDNLRPEIRTGVESLQKAWGRELPIVSGFRDPERNRKAGGAKRSQHQHGNAVDIDVSSLSRAERIELIKLASGQGFKGIGVYADSIHLDYGTKRYWGPSHGAKSLPAWAKAAIEEHMGRKA